jgi:hypothetical protein
MAHKFFQHWEDELDPHRSMTKRQYRMIKWLCNSNHLIRAESVARQIIDKNLADLNQVEAHEIIVYLNEYDYRGEKFSDEDLDLEFGKALVLVKPQDAIVNTGTRILALLATNRAATSGQLGRYAFGIAQDIYVQIPSLIEPLVESLLSERLIGCKRDFRLPIDHKQVIADIYYLTEVGSDGLHKLAPHINYYARPGLPVVSHLYHEICVTAARLDIQANNHLLNYEPEREIKSQFRKEFNKRLREGKIANSGEEFYAGCGDFRGSVISLKTGKPRRAEVEIIIRSRLEEVESKPSRITDYYTTTLHRSFLIEFTKKEFAKIILDLLEPCGSLEYSSPPSKPSSKRATVSQQRLQKVRSALARMAGIGTTGSVAAQTGLKATTVSEALALLVERGEILYCDGFAPTGKSNGRNLRLFHPRDVTINSVFEFGRLLTAAKFVGSKLTSVCADSAQEVLAFEPNSGLLFLNNNQNNLTLAIVDDPTELPERVIGWAHAVYKYVESFLQNGSKNNVRTSLEQAQTKTVFFAMMAAHERWKGFTKDQILILTYGQKRLQQFRSLTEFLILDVAEEEKSDADSAGKSTHRRSQISANKTKKKYAC